MKNDILLNGNLFNLYIFFHSSADKDDVLRYADRLSMRTLTVDVLVKVQRDLVQQEALHQVVNLKHK